MQEGIFAKDSRLSVRVDGETTELRNASEIYDYLCIRDSAKPAQMVLTLRGKEYPVDEISGFMNEVLHDEAVRSMPEASKNWQQFHYEIMDSLNHEALAMVAKLHFEKSLEAEKTQHKNIFDWLSCEHGQKWISAHKHDVDSFLLQMGSFDGHPTHPANKMRLRIDPRNKDTRHEIDADEAQKYFPEFSPDVPLQLYAVKTDKATSNTSAMFRKAIVPICSSHSPKHLPVGKRKWIKNMVRARQKIIFLFLCIPFRRGR